jgi:hypothetical protein
VPQKARQNPYVFVNCVVSLAGAAKSPSFGGRESRPVECNGVLRSRRLSFRGTDLGLPEIGI